MKRIPEDNVMKRSASMPKLLMKKNYNIHSIPGIIVLKGNANKKNNK